MKKSNIVYLVAIVFALLLSVIILSGYMSLKRKASEDFFNTKISKSCYNLFKGAYSRHISEKNTKRKELLENLKGAPLTADEKYMQLQYGVSDMSKNINSNTNEITDSKGIELSSSFTYYDSDMNSIMKENTLLLVKRARAEKADATLYYTYQDDSLTEYMNDIISKYGDDIENVEFHLKDAYIKDFSFVPMRLSYVAKDENGSELKETELISNIDKEDELKKDGYELYEIDNTFHLFTSFFDHDEDSSYISYISQLSDEEHKRLDELIEEAKRLKTNDDTYIYFSKKPTLITTEYISVQQYSSGENDDTFYLMTYEKHGIFSDLINFWVIQKGGIVYTFLLIPIIVVIFIISLVVARTYIRKKLI